MVLPCHDYSCIVYFKARWQDALLSHTSKANLNHPQPHRPAQHMFYQKLKRTNALYPSFVILASLHVLFHRLMVVKGTNVDNL